MNKTVLQRNFTKSQLNTLIDMAYEECDNLFKIQAAAVKNEK